ncbi:PREDICTED: uncharacterized protein LOC108567935 [Nicrophorus vespilloides]|uniref:Uncharacterized protein LOC108567935 n=1 Tax=Nicrophorus vespilloides TaxID=110193 RepID=A0ABM1NBN6_NICVS|nr:PREDICTED: uncharacterized protein LOC108567935 [Nicrophorus vespilloides]
MKNLIENGMIDEETKETESLHNDIYENAPTRPVTSDISPTENVQVVKENNRRSDANIPSEPVKNFVKIPENNLIGSDKNLAEAAIKIQSTFRGYKVRKNKDEPVSNVGEIADNNNKEDHKNKNEVINDVIAKIEAKQKEELEKIASPKIQSNNKSVDEYINSLIEEQPKVKPSLGQFFQNLAKPTINKINNKELEEPNLDKLKVKSDEIEKQVKSSIEDLENLSKEIENEEKKAEPFYLHEPSKKKLDTPISAAFRASPQVGNYSPTNIQVVVQDQRGNSPTSVQSIQSQDGLTFQANDAPGQVFVIIQVLRQ